MRKLDYAKLRGRLLADKQVLAWTGPKRAGGIDAKTLPGIVMDDEAAERKGFDAISATIGPFVNNGYRHDGGKGHGLQTARFQPDLPQAGKYEVRLAYTANANRATNVPVSIVHADGQAAVKVNQQKTPPIDKLFLSLGTFRFEKGKHGYVEIGNKDANGYVIIDAVQWLPVKD